MTVNAWGGVATQMPAAGPEWFPVVAGESGASVLRDRDGERFAKIVPIEDSETLAAERERLAWLGDMGFPVASVLDWYATDEGACLITRAVPGVPADQLDAVALRQAWPAITRTMRELHEIPVASCPFDRSLAVMMPLARRTVSEDRVQEEFLPEELRQVSPTQILRLVEDELLLRSQQENAEQVVCHGDFCLPNILIDPETSQVSGLVDLGRLGRADPYADIALLLANARETWPDEAVAREADHAFAEQYGISLDMARQRFYLRLDPLTWPG